MRATLTALLLSLATPAAADLSLSAEIGLKGLTPTATRLAALPDRSPQDRFALAGLRFLTGVERALQLRWQTGVRADWSELPILRLPIPENPAPRPLQGADITALFQGLASDMEAARDALPAQDFGLEIALNDLWFDIDANGLRSEGESLSAVAGLTLAGAARFGFQPVDNPVIRFDTADAAWLSAYTHFLQAFAEVALAYDPAPAVDRVLASSAQIKALWGTTPPPNAMDMMFGRQVDRVAMILNTLATKPDPDFAKSAHTHLLDMIAENRRFWALVEAETDNDREWVPNDRQQSGLGLPVPQGTGARWQAVLADAEGVLTGKLLVPHWRYGAEAGIDLQAIFADPPAIDLVAFIQGEGLLTYARKGPRVSPDNWQQFQRLVEGDAGLFAVFLN